MKGNSRRRSRKGEGEGETNQRSLPRGNHERERGVTKAYIWEIEADPKGRKENNSKGGAKKTSRISTPFLYRHRGV